MSHGLRPYTKLGWTALCFLSLIWMAPAAAAQSGGAWGFYPESTADAARFLEYSTLEGPSISDVWHLERTGYGAVLEEQFAAPPSSYPTLQLVPSTIPADCDAICRRDNYTLYPLQTRFFRNAFYGPDQLRQRVAFALHQIIVVSGLEITTPSRMAPYLEILDRNAFGNFRQLLYEITLNPAMGNYLDMAGNNAPVRMRIMRARCCSCFPLGSTNSTKMGPRSLARMASPFRHTTRSRECVRARLYRMELCDGACAGHRELPRRWLRLRAGTTREQSPAGWCDAVCRSNGCQGSVRRPG